MCQKYFSISKTLLQLVLNLYIMLRNVWLRFELVNEIVTTISLLLFRCM